VYTRKQRRLVYKTRCAYTMLVGHVPCRLHRACDVIIRVSCMGGVLNIRYLKYRQRSTKLTINKHGQSASLNSSACCCSPVCSYLWKRVPISSLHSLYWWPDYCAFACSQISVTHKNQVPMLMAPTLTKKSSLFSFFRRWHANPLTAIWYHSSHSSHALLPQLPSATAVSSSLFNI